MSEPSVRETAPADGAPEAAGGARRLPFVPRLVLAFDGRLLALVCVVGALSGVLASGYFFALKGMLKLSDSLGDHVPVWALMPAAGFLVGLFWLLGEPGETD
ncbi:MAG TPA: hypothetical protein VMV18_14360, partial [bacterium]|nr:hypothetical protein [bacterium]